MTTTRDMRRAPEAKAAEAKPAPMKPGETKAAEGGDVSAAFDDFLSAFEAFKATNDDRLAEIEQKLSADPLTVEKLDRINRSLDELTLKSRRPPLSSDRNPDRRPSEHRSAFEAYAFAAQEGTAFVSGDGTNKPKGFLAYTTAAESAWAWGKIGYVATGVSGALPASNPSDVLIDLIYTLKAGYRANARFVLNRRTQAAIRKLKDADGNYLWQPAAVAGGEASLLGFPVTEAEDMPDIGANALSLAFGDFKRGYLVVDRLGVSVLRDPYSAKPYVLFYTVKRVGGGVQDFDAIKLLKFGTS